MWNGIAYVSALKINSVGCVTEASLFRQATSTNILIACTKHGLAMSLTILHSRETQGLLYKRDLCVGTERTVDLTDEL